MRYSPTEPPETQMPQTVSFEFSRDIAQTSCVRRFFATKTSLQIFACFLSFCSLFLDKIQEKKKILSRDAY